MTAFFQHRIARGYSEKWSLLLLSLNVLDYEQMQGKPKQVCVKIPRVNRESTPAFERRVTGEGLRHSGRKRQRLQCPLCPKSLQKGSIRAHLLRVHGVHPDTVAALDTPCSLRQPPIDHQVSFPLSRGEVPCPVEGCPFNATSRTELRKHFMIRHPIDSLVVLEEGPLPRCERCDMFVHRMHLDAHRKLPFCRQGERRKAQRCAAADARQCKEVVFSAYGTPLDSVQDFTYLGRVLSHDDRDDLAMYRNLKKAKSRWGLVRRVLTREGASPRVSAMFYKAVVQTVLLYGAETWNVTRGMLSVLDSFHNRMARALTGRKPVYVAETEEWIYPPTGNAMEEAGLWSMETYLQRRRRYLVEYIATHPLASDIMEMGLEGILQYYGSLSNRD